MSSDATSPAAPNLEVAVLSATISSPLSPPISVPVQVSVRNPASSPVTLLKWGSPLDPRANILGVFEIRDTESGDTVPMDVIKISRKLPPLEEELVQIPAGEAIETTVTLPRVSLENGRQYEIRAKGRWHAVWEQPREGVAAQQLEKLSGAQRGEFSSPAVPIRVEYNDRELL